MFGYGLIALLAASTTVFGTGGQEIVKVDTNLVEVRPVVECSDRTGPPMGLPGKKPEICLGREVILSLADIQDVYVRADSVYKPGRYWVLAFLDSSGSTKWRGYTRSNIGKRIGIVFKAKLLAAPMIKAQIMHPLFPLKDFENKDEAEWMVHEITKAIKRGRL